MIQSDGHYKKRKPTILVQCVCKSSIHLNDQKAYINISHHEQEFWWGKNWQHRLRGISIHLAALVNFRMPTVYNDWAQAQQHFDQLQFKSDRRHFCLLSIATFVSLNLGGDTLKTRRGGHFSSPAAASRYIISLWQRRNFEWTQR